MHDGEGRVTVSTYVPAYQRDRWREDADRLGMNQSEFVRSMVQAGRRGFALGGEPDGKSRNPEGPDVPGSNPGGNDLKTAVLELLQREGRMDWSELVEELTGDLEAGLEAAITELQREGRVQHSPRRGDYGIAEASDGE